MDKEITIVALNDLVEINNDRIIGYDTALKETEDSVLHILFSKCILTSKKCASELKMEIVKLGGDAEKGTKATGKLHRLWMDFKSLISVNDRSSILGSCAFGDSEAMKTYNDTLNDNLQNLDTKLQKLIMAQGDLIKIEWNEIQLLEKLAEVV